jgi:hypothetical protein
MVAGYAISSKEHIQGGLKRNFLLHNVIQETLTSLSQTPFLQKITVLMPMNVNFSQPALTKR